MTRTNITADQNLQATLLELEASKKEPHRATLEKLTMYFLQRLNLEFKLWLKLDNATNKFEVGAIAEGTFPVFQRWQVLCKHLPSTEISSDDIAERVGLSLKYKSDVILIVTTGLFQKAATEFADSIMRGPGLSIITIDRNNLQTLATSPDAIVDLLESKAKRVASLRKIFPHEQY